MQKYFRDLDVAERYGIGRSTVWHWVRSGRLPQPIKLASRTTRWTLGQLEEFENSRPAREVAE